MEGRQSKCNYCIHALLGWSHFQSFNSECENRTLALLQRFVGLVLLELSELSSRAFSQSGNNFSCAVPVMMLHPFRRNKGQIFISIAQAWQRNEASKPAFWFGSSTYRLHRYRCHIGSGFRYPTLVVTHQKYYFIYSFFFYLNIFVIYFIKFVIFVYNCFFYIIFLFNLFLLFIIIEIVCNITQQFNRLDAQWKL